MIKASMGMVGTVMVGTRDTTIALFHELDRQHGMAGDDDAGRAFAKVYTSAASTTLDKMGFSAYVTGETGKGLMRNAREFMARDSQIASAILNKQVDLTAGMGDPGADCSESFLGLGQELPEAIGDTAWYDQYAPAGTSDRFRGSPEKLRDVAGSWRAGGKMMLRFLEDAQAYAHTADQAHSGEAADAFRSYFKAFVGFAEPPERAQQDETLVANLIAACNQLAKACDRYADHVEAAKQKIIENDLDPFHFEMPWDSRCSAATATTADSSTRYSAIRGSTSSATSPMPSTSPRSVSSSPKALTVLPGSPFRHFFLCPYPHPFRWSSPRITGRPQPSCRRSTGSIPPFPRRTPSLRSPAPPACSRPASSSLSRPGSTR
ncbi:WXG100 family type VII secretion target [Streptomyces sp. NPDC058914]|uniref:WXG100 family type VII secretion target n=1 Tax=Streptomyces sp. NPDC058914 TaxID=3346671 RepID=UPI0036AE4809